MILNLKYLFGRGIAWLVLAILPVLSPLIASQPKQEQFSFPLDSVEIDSAGQFFLSNLSFKKLYLVFAGPFPSSPTSSFGHVFALIEPLDNRPFLMWDAVDFSADVTDVGNFEFMLQGMFGSLDGQYQIRPFYEKLREYTFIESRSLWLFPVNLDTEESREFCINLYQTQGKIFPYVFSNRNCASEIYRLINTSKKIPEDISSSFVFPNSVINKTNIDSAIYIESISAALAKSDINITYNDSTDNNLDIDNQASIKRRLIYLEWKYFKEQQALNTAEKNELKRLRKEVLRNDNSEYSSLYRYNKKFNMHPLMFADIGAGYSKTEGAIYRFGYRFGLHDFVDKAIVYPKHDYLNMAKIEMEITYRSVHLNEFLLFDQTSLQPVSFLSSLASWKLGIGIKTRAELGDRELATGLFLGYGYSFRLFCDELIFSILANIDAVYLGDNDYSLLLSPEAILRWYITDNIRLMTSVRQTFKNISSIKTYYGVENRLVFNLGKEYLLIMNSSISRFNSTLSLQLAMYL